MVENNQKKKYELKTVTGIKLDELASWLQKALRRNRTMEALWIAEEMLQSGFQKYLLYRLWVCACEDVGPANLELVQLATSIYQTWILQRKEKGKSFTFSGENRVFNGLLINLLTTSKKSRIADDSTQYVMHLKAQGWKPEMNRLAVIDSHVSEGKKLYGRGYRHWLEIGSKCANLLDEKDLGMKTYKIEAEKLWKQLADSEGEPECEHDPEIEELKLK